MLLGLAYAVFEEGLVTQSLFNPGYFGADLLSTAYIPALGMGAWWTIYVLALHSIWSTNVPIALVESLVPERATRPWLGRIGLAVAAILFVFGALVSFFGTYQFSHFLASPGQLIGSVVAIVVLVFMAFSIDVPHSSLPEEAPHPWLVGVVAFVASSLFLSVGRCIPLDDWLIVGFYLVLAVVMIWLVSRWSRQQGWGAEHRLALAGGALLTYAWHAFPQQPSIGSPGTIDLVGNTLFALGAVVLLAAAIVKVRQTATADRSQPASS
jgi:hypothetical protein